MRSDRRKRIPGLDRRPGSPPCVTLRTYCRRCWISFFGRFLASVGSRCVNCDFSRLPQPIPQSMMVSPLPWFHQSQCLVISEKQRAMGEFIYCERAKPKRSLTGRGQDKEVMQKRYKRQLHIFVFLISLLLPKVWPPPFRCLDERLDLKSLVIPESRPQGPWLQQIFDRNLRIWNRWVP